MKTTVKVTEYIIDGYITYASDRKTVEFDTLSEALAFVYGTKGELIAHTENSATFELSVFDGVAYEWHTEI